MCLFSNKIVSHEASGRKSLATLTKALHLKILTAWWLHPLWPRRLIRTNFSSRYSEWTTHLFGSKLTVFIVNGIKHNVTNVVTGSILLHFAQKEWFNVTTSIGNQDQDPRTRVYAKKGAKMYTITMFKLEQENPPKNKGAKKGTSAYVSLKLSEFFFLFDFSFLFFYKYKIITQWNWSYNTRILEKDFSINILPCSTIRCTIRWLTFTAPRIPYVFWVFKN